MSRIKYYSSTDLSTGHSLLNCEKILKSFDHSIEYEDINDILEFYNVTLFFDNELKLLKWSNTEYQNYKSISAKMKKVVYNFFNSIENNNFKAMYNSVSHQYKDNFWTLFNEKINDLDIDNTIFDSVLNSNYVNVYDILCNKKIVKKYDDIIKKYLVENVDIGADVLVHLYLIKKDKIYIPDSLTNNDKIEIIKEYVSLKQASLDYLEMLVNISDGDIPLDVRERKRIKNRINELKDELFKNGIKIDTTYSVGFVPDLDEPVKLEATSRKVRISFDLNWIRDNLDKPTILNNFIFLLEYVDSQYRWNVVTKKRHLGLVDGFFTTRASNDYLVSSAFQTLNILANMQQVAYYDQLLKFDVRLERIIEWFFNEYLHTEFGIDNFNVTMSSNSSTFLEKSRNDLAELEGVLKKYNFYSDDGYIDLELVSMSSKPIPFENIKSVLKNKYIYVNNKNEFENICYALFSEQCMLKYIERIGDHYNCFFDLLLNNEVYKDDIRQYDEYWLNILIENNLVYIEDNIIKIEDVIMINILRDLYENEVLSYWRLSSKMRKIVDSLVNSGLLKASNSLLSIPEADYLNYMLNNKYSNSLFLRNMYLHGTQPAGGEELHKSNYMIILRLFILVIIKINDELCLRESADYLEKQN